MAGEHVVFGAGQIGRGLAARLAGLGLPVRVVTRRDPGGLPAGVTWQAADAADPAAAAAAAGGAAVVYQCLNAPYADWPRAFPPLQRGVLAAARQAGALLVTLENLYGYGPTGGAPLTEDLPLAATAPNGRARAAMTAELLAAAAAGEVRVAIGRAADFFGPGVTVSSLGEQVFARALAGRPAYLLGDPDLPHSYSYAPDVAAGLATLGTDERAVGHVWHLPAAPATPTRDILQLIAGEIGRPVRLRVAPRLAVRAAALVAPMVRAITQTTYQFDEPFIMDTARFTTTFGIPATPLPTAVAATVAWYRTRSAPK